MKKLQNLFFLFCRSKVFLLLCILNTVQSTSGETSALDNDFKEGAIRAIFVTRPKQEMVNVGAELRLPCFLETMFDYVLIWKFSSSGGQTDTILSVGQRVIDRGGRVNVEREGEGNWLVVSQVEVEDSGTYTCIVSAFQPKSVEHQVIVHSRQPEFAVEQDVVKGGQKVNMLDHVSTEHSDLDGDPTLFGDYEASTEISRELMASILRSSISSRCQGWSS